MEALERQLQASANMGIQDYLILTMLADAPEKRLRMSELAFMSHGSSSRTSHAVDRLETRGWVQRIPSSVDGRGSVAVLTPAGVEQANRAIPAHVEVMRSYLFDLISAEELAVMGRVMFAVMSAFDSPQMDV
jgi:DNA-binding MarR family transcriptional regulator